MRIALLTDGLFPFKVGGMQKHSYYLAKYMARMGVDVDLYYALWPDADTSTPEADLFTAHEQQRIRLRRILIDKGPHYPGHYIVKSYQISQYMYDSLENISNVDFVYAQGFTGWKFGKEKSRGTKLPPLGVHFHGLEMYQKSGSLKSKLEQWMFKPFVRQNLLAADVAFSLGGGLRTILQSVGVHNKSILESPNGIAASWLKEDAKPKESKTTFVFIGRYARRKGIEELHEVIHRLSEYDYFDIHFIGPIPEQLWIDLPQVTYWGLVKDEEKIQDILSEAQVLVCPSYSEGMPTVILEAMAMGLSIIGTDVGAIRALITPDNGWLIPPGDTHALYAAMVDAINTPHAILLDKQRASLDIAPNYLWEAVAKQTITNIEHFLAGQPGGSTGARERSLSTL